MPWLSRLTGRPAVVAVRPFVDEARPTSIPEGTLILATTWPSAARMARVPETLPGAPCYESLPSGEQRAVDLGWEDWLDAFLADVLDTPDGALAVEDVQSLGPDREVIGLGILRAWGWVRDEDGTFPTLPSPPFAELLADLSRHTRRLPSELLRLPFPEFVLNYRIVLRKIVEDAVSGGR